MRSIRNPRLERGEVRIKDIALDHKCRDDLIAILIGIQYLYLQEDLRERLFALLDKYILPGTNRKVGRPGMDMWSILVLGLIKQGTNCDYDQQFPITFKLSGPAPNLGVRHGSVVAGASWGHSNTIQAAAWLVKLR